MDDKVQWVITLRESGVNLDTVGPFDSEAEADAYVDETLKPAMPSHTFYIHELVSPRSLKESLTKGVA